MTDSLTTSTSMASLDDWDLLVAAHGRATRYQPARLLLDDLTTDFTDLSEAFARPHPASVTRRLTRTIAQMAGLISLTLLKLGARHAARSWGRTARLAADEAGDPALSSWVRAQDAYTIFYTFDVRQAALVAQQAQAAAGRTVCVGAVLAAALEARAHAILGHPTDADTAITRAETILSALTPDDTTDSAFGYNEAQLRFHHGNALTHLHDSRRAGEAQRRALELYPTDDYLDRALVHLEQAACLLHDGEIAAGASHAAQVLLDLPAQQRDGIIVSRAREIAQAVTPRDGWLPAIHRDPSPAQELVVVRKSAEPGEVALADSEEKSIGEFGVQVVDGGVLDSPCLGRSAVPEDITVPPRIPRSTRRFRTRRGPARRPGCHARRAHGR
ncbi:hypothetical protein [Frankia umida]|uniref:hypothetical protein n=1 Tax=Frankia umida TaxID=573489 RepID=UPI0020103CEB|nr:hypothetical protein [Frankia umida]